MKTIAVFGCSFSAGHGLSNYKWINWPTELLLLNNDKHILYNCALPGSNIDYSMFALYNFLKYKKPDIVLFQFTFPLRHSWILLDEKLNSFNNLYNVVTYKDLNIPINEICTTKYLSLQNYNIVRLNQDVNWGYITPGSTNHLYSPIKFAEDFYTIIGDNLIDRVKFLSYIHYLKNSLLKDIPHLFLAHDKYFLEGYVNTDFLDLDFKGVLGEEYFEKNVIDEGKHLSHEAIKKIAEIINERMKGFL